MRLLGPVSFDPLSLDRSARDLLGAWRHDRGSLGEGDGTVPGLYLLADDEGALRGFWLVFGERWLDDGAIGGRAPPFAAQLLEAAVEEVWWDHLTVAPRLLDAWRPLIVLEWPAMLADRSMLPPPGVPLDEVAFADDRLDIVSVAQDEPVGAGWLDPVQVRRGGDGAAADDRTEELAFDEVEDRDDPWPSLPRERGVVCIVRGSMRRRRGVHTGRFELVCMPSPEALLGVDVVPASWRAGIPADEWLQEAATCTSVPPVAPELGYPVRLPGAPRVAFPLTGWLTRDLDVQPSSPRDAAAGELVARDTSNPLIAQVMLAASVTSALLLSALGFARVTDALSQPVLDAAARPIATTVQPAISVCSPDHDGFVEQLRCQVDALARGVPRAQVSCREVSEEAATADLQAAWCGLRQRDWGTAEGGRSIHLAQVAASQACFDVLGRSYRYRDPDAPPGSNLANPAALLYDDQLQIDALNRVVGELDRACERYEPRLEAQVAGAILATHLGVPPAQRELGGPTTLASLGFEVAESATGAARDEARACLVAGSSEGGEGPHGARVLDDLCGGGLPSVVAAEGGAWAKLAAAPDHPPKTSVVARYVQARFGGQDDVGSITDRPTVWGCFDYLERGRARASVQGLWDLSWDAPQRWGGRPLRSQLRLDALLRVLRDDRDVGDVCWREVDRLLVNYAPVHPLLPAAGEVGWPSEEQRVCGDVCASAYGVARPGGEWVTRGTDLAMCVTDAPPPRQDRDRVGREELDVLRMPWNGEPWVAPATEAVCGFNLIAQGRLANVLPEGRSAPEWSGELVAGRRIAGGEGGAAVRSARDLATFGRRRSVATCSDVAVQCFVEELLEVVSDPAVAPLEWRSTWQDQIAALPARLDDPSLGGPEARPWCALVQPYLYADGQLPEGELDLPCALGVSQARERVAELAGRLAKRAYEEAAP